MRPTSDTRLATSGFENIGSGGFATRLEQAVGHCCAGFGATEKARSEKAQVDGVNRKIENTKDQLISFSQCDDTLSTSTPFTSNLELALFAASLAHSLVDERLVNVRNDTSSRNGGLDERVQFFVSPNGELQMARRNALDLEILAGITRQLEDFGREVLEDGRRVDGRGRSDAVALVHGLLEETVHTTDGELQTSLAGTRLGSLFGGRGLAALASFAAFSTFSGLRAVCEQDVFNGRGEWHAKFG